MNSAAPLIVALQYTWPYLWALLFFAAYPIVTSIMWIMGLAFAAGVIAAVIPAWRATRLDVLRAVAADG